MHVMNLPRRELLIVLRTNKEVHEFELWARTGDSSFLRSTLPTRLMFNVNKIIFYDIQMQKCMITKDRFHTIPQGWFDAPLKYKASHRFVCEYEERLAMEIREREYKEYMERSRNDIMRQMGLNESMLRGNI